MAQKKNKFAAPGQKPLLQVGKNGLSEGFLAELDKSIKVHKIVKIKLLQSFADTADKKTVAQNIADALQVHVVKVIGNTMTFSKKGEKRNK